MRPPKNSNKPTRTNSLLRAALNHLLAIILSIIGLLITIIFGQPITNTPLLVFIPVVILSSAIGGLSAGILSAVCSAALITYYFISPFRSINFLEPLRAVQFILITVEGIFLSIIFETGKRQEKINAYKQRERELNKKLIGLEEENKRYEKEIRSRDEFLSIASHELKTPLTSMLLQTQTALHNIRNVSVAQFSFESLLKMLESVENQTKRLSKMINDLLAVSVITIGNLNLEYEELELGKLVKGVLIDFQARLEKENIQVLFKADEKIIGNWDKIRLEQAISNFISNAIKYGEHNPIEIRVTKKNHHTEFIIKDSGIGISKSKQKRIFELFQRAVAPEEYKGLGVGLYITQKIVNSHGGTVDVSSTPGRGSQFTMKLPLKRPNK